MKTMTEGKSTGPCLSLDRAILKRITDEIWWMNVRKKEKKEGERWKLKSENLKGEKAKKQNQKQKSKNENRKVVSRKWKKRETKDLEKSRNNWSNFFWQFKSVYFEQRAIMGRDKKRNSKMGEKWIRAHLNESQLKGGNVFHVSRRECNGGERSYQVIYGIDKAVAVI